MNERIDKSILAALFAGLVIALFAGHPDHDTTMFLSGSATTVLGGLIGIIRPGAQQQNTIKDSTVNAPVDPKV